MYKEKINIKKVVDYWAEGAEQNFDTAKSKNLYLWLKKQI